MSVEGPHTDSKDKLWMIQTMKRKEIERLVDGIRASHYQALRPGEGACWFSERQADCQAKVNIALATPHTPPSSRPRAETHTPRPLYFALGPVVSN